MVRSRRGRRLRIGRALRLAYCAFDSFGQFRDILINLFVKRISHIDNSDDIFGLVAL
jgi:hypothetical protein